MATNRTRRTRNLVPELTPAQLEYFRSGAYPPDTPENRDARAELWFYRLPEYPEAFAADIEYLRATHPPGTFPFMEREFPPVPRRKRGRR